MFNVILPTYNEASNIICLINMLIAIFNKMNVAYKLIVVDDNSPDRTAEIVKNKNLNFVEVIERKGKLGLGSAYKEGIKHCTYEYTIIIDVDLQQNPFDIIGMAQYCKDYDIVSSTRYASKAKYVESAEEVVTLENAYKKIYTEKIVQGKVCNWSFLRKLISAGANTLAKKVLDLKLSDLTCSFRIYKTDFLRKIIKKVKNNSFGFQMEIIARSEYENAKIKEYPITFYNRMFGESKLSFKDIFMYFYQIGWLYLAL